MSDYYSYEVYRLPFNKTSLKREELDRLEDTVYDSKYIPRIGKFDITYTTSENCIDLIVRENDIEGEFGVARELLEKEIPIVKEMFDIIPMLKGRYNIKNVHYVNYGYYNCSEPPFYYKVESPLLD